MDENSFGTSNWLGREYFQHPGYVWDLNMDMMYAKDASVLYCTDIYLPVPSHY